MPQSAARAAAHASAAKDRSSLYEEITNKILAQLEAGRLPWVQPWGSSGVRAPLGMPKNAATGRTYSGINVLILWDAVVEQGYATQSWLTFRQTLALGGHVRKGERGNTVVYADRFVPDDVRDRAHERGEEPRAIPFLKRFTVFNVEQCQGLPDGIAAAPPPVDATLILPQVEELIRATGPTFASAATRPTTMWPATTSACPRRRPSTSRSTGTERLYTNYRTGLAPRAGSHATSRDRSGQSHTFSRNCAPK
jgi:antirestriction protein ArdC